MYDSVYTQYITRVTKQFTNKTYNLSTARKLTWPLLGSPNLCFKRANSKSTSCTDCEL